MKINKWEEYCVSVFTDLKKTFKSIDKAKLWNEYDQHSQLDKRYHKQKFVK